MNNLSISGRYSIYLLILFSVASFSYIIINLIRQAGLEHIDRQTRRDQVAGTANNLDYFISRSTLLQLQFSCGVLLWGILIGILLFCQIFNPVILLLSGAVIFGVGLLLPRCYFARKVKKRAAEFEAGILDLALGLTNGLHAGQALPQALELFARRTEPGPLKEELQIVLREYHLGVSLPDALQRLYDRLPCEDLQLLVVSIRLTSQSGGTLTEVLQRIGETIRSRNDFHQKLQALTAQGRFEALAMSLAPLVAFLLLFFLNNELMLPMVTTVIGWCGIAVMAVLELIGYLAIRLIIDIRV